MTLLMNAASRQPLLREPSDVRRSCHAGLRAGAVAAGLVLGSWVTAAIAAPPEGWENAINDSMLVSLLKLFGIPLTVIAAVTLLTYLPVIMRGGREPVDSASWFAEHSEWFGGPRTSPDAVESRADSPGTQVATRGGASARW